ncbi:MAG: radical SAM protein [Candidatus Omnitrophica bacterium]|nr:radical SAM protein [Candidatus Omnitrophota bacterium]
MRAPRLDKIASKTTLAFELLGSRFFSTARPLVVGWRLTHRCNMRCANCHLWMNKGGELSADGLKGMIDRLFEQGMRAVTFTGGEPLLRDDIEDIVTYTRSKGISTALNTNGALLKEKKACLKNLDRLHLSLDGPEEINDSLRAKGAFKATCQAVDMAKEEGVPVILTALLTRKNLDCVDFLLDFARRHKVKIGFQPASGNYLGSDEANPHSPQGADYQQAIAILERAKRSEGRHIINSSTGLRHIKRFPEGELSDCLAGRLIFRVEPDGRMYSCSWSDAGQQGGPIDIDNVSKSCLRKAATCTSCWRFLPIELNSIASLRPEPVLNAFFAWI